MGKVQKRSVKIKGFETSVSVEDECWSALQKLAEERDCSVNRLIARIDRERGSTRRSQAIRIYVAGANA